MQSESIKAAQREFFRKNRAGCAFAAYIAKTGPASYGWRTEIVEVNADAIAQHLRHGIADPATEILSMVFPDVSTVANIDALVAACLTTKLFSDEGRETDEVRLIKLRAVVGSELSWVSGFGPFDFLPATRRAPFCELTIRVKPRPNYNWYFKPPIDGVVHLADLSMQGMSDKHLQKLWGVSFETTKKILGHPPDEESAAKTTFAVPSTAI